MDRYEVIGWMIQRIEDIADLFRIVARKLKSMAKAISKFYKNVKRIFE